MGAEEARHLLNRSGFDAHLEEINHTAKLSRREAVERVLGSVRQAPRALNGRFQPLELLRT